MSDYISSETRKYKRLQKRNEKAAKRWGLKEEPPKIEREEVLTEEKQVTALVIVPKEENLSLTITKQPFGYSYINAYGIDNETGQEIVTIIHLDEKEEQEKPKFKRTVKEEKKETVAEIIYLGGDIYEPTYIEKVMKSVFSVRALVVSLLLLLFIIPIYVFCTTGTLCYVSDEGNEELPRTVVWTTLNSHRDIVGNIVVLDEADRVDVEDFGSTDILTVVRSYPVYITVDGNSVTTNVLEETVEATLDKLGIEVNEEDIVSCDIQQILAPEDEVTIKRVTYREREPVEREIPFERVGRQSPLMSKEREIILTEGVNGSAEDYYLDKYIDDVFDSEELIETIVTLDPITEIYLSGDPLEAASFVDGSQYVDIAIVDGKPEEFLSVMEDAICTAYSFGPNTFGASGMRMMQGFVATNPNVIPYGTLMYIASDRFTYGWAVAADCGTAMMEGYVDIDCYFETYIESVMFGKKLLDVYIIKQLTQEELEEHVANRMFYGRVPKTADGIQ